MIYNCNNENRKNAILASTAVTLNGIDFLEVQEQKSVPKQNLAPPSLLVHCLKPVPTNLTVDNVLIVGGESITDIVATSVGVGSDPSVLIVNANHYGDFSEYTLRLVNSVIQAAGNPFELTDVLTGFDWQLAETNFSFMVGCGPDFDCESTPPDCPPAEPTPPPINYLAKDYGSFRTVILDRLSQLVPGWGGANESDLGVVLAELIAYRCDLLSYQQDAIATEAYLETARRRVSLRRHALLVDYHVHDGCNARVWMQLNVAGNPGDSIFLARQNTRFYTFAQGAASALGPGSLDTQAVLLSGAHIFEPMQDAVLFPEHNRMSFYTWGETLCCLPAGAVEATLHGSFPNLQAGDVLIFQEVLGPQTGSAADADLRHRCAVRLTQVATRDASREPLVDPLYDDLTGEPFTDPTKQTAARITEIQWSQKDALPFPLCISSSYLDSLGNQTTAFDVSVAFGNVVLADHGLSLSDAPLGIVPEPELFYPPDPSANRGEPSSPLALPVRFRAIIPSSPLTQAVPLPLAGTPVTPGVMRFDGTESVQLTDANGFTCLLIQASNSAQWPQFFGVKANVNQAVPANIDISVVYTPLAGASNSTSVTVEAFTNLSFTKTDTNFVATQINALSQFVRVPSNYIPPATPPVDIPSGVTTLLTSGAVNLSDSSNPAVIYLSLQTADPTDWLTSFGVLTQANQDDQTAFNLSLVYEPASSGIGVGLPVTLEFFSELSLATIPGQFPAHSQLITVKSFAEAPDLDLSAIELMSFDPAAAVPEISLTGTLEGQAHTWLPRQDLLGSEETERVFVVEVESDGTATVRFATPGNPDAPTEGTNGMVPDTGTVFAASYRIGNGSAGNVGADSLTQFAANDSRIQACTNPLPASGGTDPETSDQIRRRAPQAFLTQERAVTLADYESIAESNFQVDQAVASLRWTGSWYSVSIAVEPQGGGNLLPELQQSLTSSVNRYRLAGQDLQLNSPQYVSLQIALEVTVDPDYFQANVEKSLLQVLSNRRLPNGRKGLFFPDNFTFGQTVYLSPVYAAARSVPGVLQVTATKFQPQGTHSSRYLAAGEIKLGSLQVARLENDPSLPNHGQLTLKMLGGK